MNEIQKANARVAIEYWEKVLSGEPFALPVYEDGAGREIAERSPDFSSSDVRFYWPQEMIAHKGGSYPKPVNAADIIGGKEYYIADLTGELMGYCVVASGSCGRFMWAINRGLVHETKKAAIQHAQVMLGVGDE